MRKKLTLGKTKTDADPHFTEIFEKEKRAVFSTAYYVLGCREDAEEVMQAVFMRLWDRMDTIDEIENMPAWLKKVASNLSIDRLRSSKRLKRTPIFDLENDFSGTGKANDSLINRELLESVFAAIKQLPPLERAAILLFAVGGIGANEIAEQFGTAPSTVRNQILQARKKINEIVQKKYKK